MIAGFEIRVIEARRLVPVGSQKNIRIDHNSTVTTISLKSPEEAKVDFRFTASYGAVGIINIEGSLIYRGDAAALVKEWEEKRRMPDEAAQEIHSAIMGNCITEAIIMAREVRLPPPIPLPKVNIQKKPGKPVPGPEVM